MHQQPGDSGCLDLALAQTTMVLLEIPKFVKYTRGKDIWRIRILFVTAWAAIAPYSGLGL